MPPFFPQMLERSFGSQSYSSSFLAGILYVVPTIFAALSSPFWGYLADQYGKKKLLLRAQLGLAFSFLLAGFARTPFQFFFALLLQGILGGTYSASRAFLADLVTGEELSLGLTLMETAPRAALVIAPCIAGTLLSLHSPIEIYKYLSILPFLASLLTWRISDSKIAPNILKDNSKDAIELQSPQAYPSTDSWITPHLIFFIQLFYVTTTVLISPFFSTLAKSRFSFLSNGQIGLLFSLPHITYLAAASPLSRYLKRARAMEVLIAALLLQCLTLIGQAYSEAFSMFIIWRAIMGLAMTACFVSFHHMISQFTNIKNAGSIFGWLETSTRGGTVLGGALASLGFQYFGATPLFIFSALILAPTSIALFSQLLSFHSKEKVI